MASSFSAFLGGVATVAVALGIGFGGGLYLTDTSLMNDPVGGRTSKQDQPKEAQAPAPKTVAPASQPHQMTPAAPVSVVEKSPPQSTVAAPRMVTQQAAAPATTGAAPVRPAATTAATPPSSPPEQPATPAATSDADRFRMSGPPFARIPEDARARATPDDEESTKAQRRKAVAAQKVAERQRRAERQRLERAERLAAENEMRAAIAARDRARHRYDQDNDDEPRGFIGFASDRRPTFFGIPLFGD